MARPFRIGMPAAALVVASALTGAPYAAEVAMIPAQPPLVAPSPSPTPDPAVARELDLFLAIADGNTEAMRLALNAGADPNGSLPAPAPEEIRKRYPDGSLEYYFRHEKGFTPLMFAAAIGNETAARWLLMAGADRYQRSRSSGTFALWQAARNKHVAVMKLLMGITPQSESARYHVEVDLGAQRATVWKDGAIVLTTEISSGRPSKPTPPGDYLVTDKYRDWKSTLYPARMPYFLRLSCGNFGLHAGSLPGYPASHGCVRLPAENAKKLFALLPIGTEVVIR
jgi:lipoprotein-anchoring transpeptidase ErfK/SrfK